MKNAAPLVFALASLLVTGCESADEKGGGGDSPDASTSSAMDGGNTNSDGGSTNAPDAGEFTSELQSTLTSDCGAVLQGRAIVNFNGNLGISFTEDSGAFTFLGSIQFELPSGFSGQVSNPENWDGNGERHVVGATTGSFALHGNHCWLDGPPNNPGSVTISDYRPSQGIVKAQFNNLRLRSCVGTTVCTINGAIETTDEGVF